MVEIKLAKLPDRAPVKLTIAASPELKLALDEYAVFYARVYGVEEPIAELIPAMLAAFLESDRVFARDRKGRK